MKHEHLIRERNELRDKWHGVREKRLELKKTLAEEEKSFIDVRHNPDYKKLKKEQKHISKMIKHIENKIFREIKNEA